MAINWTAIVFREGAMRAASLQKPNQDYTLILEPGTPG